MDALIKAPISALKEWSALNARFQALVADCYEARFVSLEDEAELESLLAGFAALQRAHGMKGPNAALEGLAKISQCAIESAQRACPEECHGA